MLIYKYYAAFVNTCLAATIVLNQRPDLHQLLCIAKCQVFLFFKWKSSIYHPFEMRNIITCKVSKKTMIRKRANLVLCSLENNHFTTKILLGSLTEVN